MAQDLVPIRVRIGLRANGHADHPDWTQLPFINSDADVKQHVHKRGWMYSKKSGHDDDDVNSPQGVQYGMLWCSEQFADAAEDAFNDDGTDTTLTRPITRLSEAEAGNFYNNEVTAHMSDSKFNNDTLQGLSIILSTILDLKAAGDNTLDTKIKTLRAKFKKAIDADDDTEPGVLKDKLKAWSDARTKLGINFKAGQIRQPHSSR